MFTFPLSLKIIILVSSKDNFHETNLSSESTTHDNCFGKDLVQDMCFSIICHYVITRPAEKFLLLRGHLW